MQGPGLGTGRREGVGGGKRGGGRWGGDGGSGEVRRVPWLEGNKQRHSHAQEEGEREGHLEVWRDEKERHAAAVEERGVGVERSEHEVQPVEVSEQPPIKTWSSSSAAARWRRAQRRLSTRDTQPPHVSTHHPSHTSARSIPAVLVPLKQQPLKQQTLTAEAVRARADERQAMRQLEAARVMQEQMREALAAASRTARRKAAAADERASEVASEAAAYQHRLRHAQTREESLRDSLAMAKEEDVVQHALVRRKEEQLARVRKRLEALAKLSRKQQQQQQGRARGLLEGGLLASSLNAQTMLALVSLAFLFGFLLACAWCKGRSHRPEISVSSRLPL